MSKALIGRHVDGMLIFATPPPYSTETSQTKTHAPFTDTNTTSQSRQVKAETAARAHNEKLLALVRARMCEEANMTTTAAMQRGHGNADASREPSQGPSMNPESFLSWSLTRDPEDARDVTTAAALGEATHRLLATIPTTTMDTPREAAATTAAVVTTAPAHVMLAVEATQLYTCPPMVDNSDVAWRQLVEERWLQVSGMGVADAPQSSLTPSQRATPPALRVLLVVLLSDADFAWGNGGSMDRFLSRSPAVLAAATTLPCVRQEDLDGSSVHWRSGTNTVAPLTAPHRAGYPHAMHVPSGDEGIVYTVRGAFLLCSLFFRRWCDPADFRVPLCMSFRGRDCDHGSGLHALVATVTQHVAQDTMVRRAWLEARRLLALQDCARGSDGSGRVDSALPAMRGLKRHREEGQQVTSNDNLFCEESEVNHGHWEALAVSNGGDIGRGYVGGMMAALQRPSGAYAPAPQAAMYASLARLKVLFDSCFLALEAHNAVHAPLKSTEVAADIVGTEHEQCDMAATEAAADTTNPMTEAAAAADVRALERQQRQLSAELTALLSASDCAGNRQVCIQRALLQVTENGVRTNPTCQRAVAAVAAVTASASSPFGREGLWGSLERPRVPFTSLEILNSSNADKSNDHTTPTIATAATSGTTAGVTHAPMVEACSELCDVVQASYAAQLHSPYATQDALKVGLPEGSVVTDAVRHAAQALLNGSPSDRATTSAFALGTTAAVRHSADGQSAVEDGRSLQQQQQRLEPQRVQQLFAALCAHRSDIRRLIDAIGSLSSTPSHASLMDVLGASPAAPTLLRDFWVKIAEQVNAAAAAAAAAATEANEDGGPDAAAGHENARRVAREETSAPMTAESAMSLFLKVQSTSKGQVSALQLPSDKGTQNEDTSDEPLSSSTVDYTYAPHALFLLSFGLCGRDGLLSGDVIDLQAIFVLARGSNALANAAGGTHVWGPPGMRVQARPLQPSISTTEVAAYAAKMELHRARQAGHRAAAARGKRTITAGSCARADADTTATDTHSGDGVTSAAGRITRGEKAPLACASAWTAAQLNFLRSAAMVAAVDAEVCVMKELLLAVYIAMWRRVCTVRQVVSQIRR